MKTKALTRFVPAKFLALTFSLLAGGFLASAQAVDKHATGSGDWNSITWNDGVTPTTAPTSSDFANIGNSYDVTLAGSGGAGQLRVGSTVGGVTSSGTLTTTGTMSINGSGSSAVRIGFSTSSNGFLNVQGGLLETTSGGWVVAGGGDGAEGTINLSGGTIASDSYVALGGINSAGQSATGNMNVSGGQITTAIDFFVGRNGSGTNTGVYTQTSGTNSVTRDLRIGTGTLATGAAIGTFLITGGELSVGRDVRIGSTGVGSGTGQMTIGSDVDFISGATTEFQVSGEGEIVFQLGANDSFESIDLSGSSATNVLDFASGAKITIDGSALVFSTGYDPIELFTFGSGQGPTALSQSNVVFDYTGFDPGFSPSLEWTDTQLLLTVPEPSVLGLIAIASVLGLSRRRRREA